MNSRDFSNMRWRLFGGDQLDQVAHTAQYLISDDGEHVFSLYQLFLTYQEYDERLKEIQRLHDDNENYKRLLSLALKANRTAEEDKLLRLKYGMVEDE